MHAVRGRRKVLSPSTGCPSVPSVVVRFKRDEGGKALEFSDVVSRKLPGILIVQSVGLERAAGVEGNEFEMVVRGVLVGPEVTVDRMVEIAELVTNVLGEESRARVMTSVVDTR